MGGAQHCSSAAGVGMGAAARWIVNQQSSSCCSGRRSGFADQLWGGGGPRIGVFGDFPRPGDAIGSVQVTRGVGIRAGVEGSPLLIGERLVC